MKVKFKEIEANAGDDCSKCIAICTNGCSGLMFNLTGIDCHKEGVIFRERETFVRCSKENTKVGDIVCFNNELKYKVTYICENNYNPIQINCILLNLVENYEFSSFLNSLKKKV